MLQRLNSFIKNLCIWTVKLKSLSYFVNQLKILIVFHIKGTVSVILSDSPCKGGNTRIEIRKVFNSDHFSMVSQKQESHKSLLLRNHKKLKWKEKHGYLIHTWSDKPF